MLAETFNDPEPHMLLWKQVLKNTEDFATYYSYKQKCISHQEFMFTYSTTLWVFSLSGDALSLIHILLFFRYLFTF